MPMRVLRANYSREQLNLAGASDAAAMQRLAVTQTPVASLPSAVRVRVRRHMRPLGHTAVGRAELWHESYGDVFTHAPNESRSDGPTH